LKRQLKEGRRVLLRLFFERSLKCVSLSGFKNDWLLVKRIFYLFSFAVTTAVNACNPIPGAKYVQEGRNERTILLLRCKDNEK
jgi:hypothetical protein